LWIEEHGYSIQIEMSGYSYVRAISRQARCAGPGR
jgi:hypothetical protein